MTHVDQVGGTNPSVRRSAASVTKQWRQLASRPSHGLGQKRTSSLLAPNTSLQFDVSIIYQLQFQVTSPVLLQQSTLMCCLWLYTRAQCKTIKSPKPFKIYQSDISFYSFKIHDYMYVGCRTDFHFLNDWGQTFPEAQALAPTQSTKKCVEFAMTIIRYWCW